MSGRILEARYTSPSGTETAFFYEPVSRETELKTGVFTFPDRDGAHVQHQGMGAKSFPLVCLFHGKTCMDDADAFEAALIERGVGELQIPYGTFKVVPTGKIKREDDLVSALGESKVTVTFTETIVEEGAAALDTVTADEIEERYEAFSEAAAEDFAAAIDTGDIGEQLAVVSALDTQTQAIADNLEPLAAASSRADFLTTLRELKDNIKNLYKKGMTAAGKVESVYVKALNIARLTLRLMKLPTNLAVSLSQKIKGYSALTAVIINQFKNDPFGAGKIRNAYAVASLALQGAVSREDMVRAAMGIGGLFDDISDFQDGKITAIETSGEDTRDAVRVIDDAVTGEEETAAALEAAGAGASPEMKQIIEDIIYFKEGKAEELRNAAGKPARRAIGILEELIAFGREAVERLEALPDSAAGLAAHIVEESVFSEEAETEALEAAEGSVDNPFVDSNSESRLLLAALVETSVQLVLNASFALPLQRAITLGRDRQVIELCAELYGSVDSETIDRFIMENNLDIDEIALMPMGKEVSYYVQIA